MLLMVVLLFSFSAFSQVALTVNKPLSESDKQEVSTILKSFDANSYKLNMKSEKGSLMMGKATAKGLASVGQKNTTRTVGSGAVASTNTNNNVFKNAVMSTNTNNNVFKVMSTNTNNNVFVQGKYTNSQLSKMDKLYTILSKYQ